MTNKEAHSYLEDLQRKYTRDRDLYKPEFIEANGLAILALERRIPKTPKIFKEKYMQPDYLCPVCDADVNTEMDCCAGCGQALNWEGVFE